MKDFLPLDSSPILFSEDIMSAISVIQKSEFKLALVVDGDRRFTGTVTDGDVRRALLAGKVLTDPVTSAMNANPIYLQDDKLSSRQKREMEDVQHIPVLDENFMPIGMYELTAAQDSCDNEILLMAGGKGTRLLPHTRDIPKPLVEINGMPLIEHLIVNFLSQGFKKFHISVGHMAEKIVDYLGDGSRLGVEIEFIHEEQPLGTAGALGALRGKLNKSIIVANADLYTSCDFRSLLNFHESLGGGLTIGLREYTHQVPFGVVDIVSTNIVGIKEKPRITQQVAAGIYCISPDIVDSLSVGSYLDMPSVVSNLISSGEHPVNGFPIHEEWEDVGRPADLLRLRAKNGADFES